VTDTGNKRLINFSRTGEALRVFGSEGSGAGQFVEPVGLARDAAGRIYVADTWNHRIQRFDSNLGSPSSFETGWASQDVLAKPYITVLNDGRIVASDPGKGELLLFSASGQRLGAWRPDSDSLPIGVAARPDGGFVFSDGRRNQLQIVPGPLVDRLFR
jgi:DNA-binding beta-propeller fold protein YncE